MERTPKSPPSAPNAPDIAVKRAVPAYLSWEYLSASISFWANESAARNTPPIASMNLFFISQIFKFLFRNFICDETRLRQRNENLLPHRNYGHRHRPSFRLHQNYGSLHPIHQNCFHPNFHLTILGYCNLVKENCSS